MIPDFTNVDPTATTSGRTVVAVPDDVSSRAATSEFTTALRQPAVADNSHPAAADAQDGGVNTDDPRAVTSRPSTKPASSTASQSETVSSDAAAAARKPVGPQSSTAAATNSNAATAVESFDAVRIISSSQTELVPEVPGFRPSGVIDATLRPPASLAGLTGTSNESDAAPVQQSTVNGHNRPGGTPARNEALPAIRADQNLTVVTTPVGAAVNVVDEAIVTESDPATTADGRSASEVLVVTAASDDPVIPVPVLPGDSSDALAYLPSLLQTSNAGRPVDAAAVTVVSNNIASADLDESGLQVETTDDGSDLRQLPSLVASPKSSPGSVFDVPPQGTETIEQKSAIVPRPAAPTASRPTTDRNGKPDEQTGTVALKPASTPISTPTRLAGVASANDSASIEQGSVSAVVPDSTVANSSETRPVVQKPTVSQSVPARTVETPNEIPSQTVPVEVITDAGLSGNPGTQTTLASQNQTAPSTTAEPTEEVVIARRPPGQSVGQRIVPRQTARQSDGTGSSPPLDEQRTTGQIDQTPAAVRSNNPQSRVDRSTAAQQRGPLATDAGAVEVTPVHAQANDRQAGSSAVTDSRTGSPAALGESSAEAPAVRASQPVATATVVDAVATPGVGLHSVSVETSTVGPAPEAAPRTLPVEVATATNAIQRVLSGQGRVRVRLDPVELGAMVVDIAHGEDGVVARLEVTTGAAHRAITETLGDLQQSLTRSGVTVDRVEVVLSENRSEGSRQERGQSSRDGRPSEQRQQGQEGQRQNREQAHDREQPQHGERQEADELNVEL